MNRMRNRRRVLSNSTSLWVVRQLGQTDFKNEDGQFTGEIQKIFGEPKKIWVTMTTNTGSVPIQSNGEGENFDFSLISYEEKLNVGDMLYLAEPTNVEDYDFRITRILESMNINRYGIESRD